jgi:hypothetical protein
MREMGNMKKRQHNYMHGINLTTTKKKVVIERSVKDFHFNLDHFAF